MQVSTQVLMFIFVFTFIPLVLAEFARNRFRYTLDDFFLQSRDMGFIMAFFTIYATWVSSFAFLGSTSSFFTNGPLYMTGFSWNILFGLIVLVIGRRIWFYGRRRGYMTATDFFDDIYGDKYLSFSITLILTIFTAPYLVIQLHGGAFLIETASGGMIPYRLAGLIFYLIIIIYLWSGGLRAVALADIFYGVLIFASMLITGIMFASKADGIENIFSTVEQEAGNTFFTLGSSDSQNSAILWLSMFIVIPLGAFMGPPMWIRMYSISSSKIFKLLPLPLAFGAIMYLGPLIAGNYAKATYPGSAFSDNMLIVLLVDNMPVAITIFIMCGIAAASLSTANSQIHALSSLYTIDIHKKYFKKNANERDLMNTGKWAVLIISLLAYTMMLIFNSGIINMGMISFSGTAQIFIPTIGALFWEKSHPKAAFAGIWTGIIVILISAAILSLPLLYAAGAGLIANALVFISLSQTLETNTKIHDRIILYKTEFINEIHKEGE